MRGLRRGEAKGWWMVWMGQERGQGVGRALTSKGTAMFVEMIQASSRQRVRMMPYWTRTSHLLGPQIGVLQ